MFFDMNAVPALKRTQVEKCAENLILEAGQALGITLYPPIDVELIADNHLGLQIVYDDLYQKYGVPDLHGALFIPKREIIVHDGLPAGRRNFTISHEVGHWVLHRHLIQGIDPNQVSLLGMAIDITPHAEIKPTLCRDSDKAWGERQADWFAAALIMPTKAVRSAFNRCFIHSQVFKKDILESFYAGYSGAELPVKPELAEERWQMLEIVNQVSDAGNFTNVSRDALRVRLTTLGLITSKSNQARIL